MFCTYVVPGDGCCGPNCAAAFLFQDEIFGPKLRRRMKMFFSKHWYKRYQYISQCSKDHPFKKKLKDGDINYTDPEELIKYLTHSSEADYMWSDGEDFHVISDMLFSLVQVQIQSLNPGFGPKLTLKLPSTPPPPPPPPPPHKLFSRKGLS